MFDYHVCFMAHISPTASSVHFQIPMLPSVIAVAFPHTADLSSFFLSSLFGLVPLCLALTRNSEGDKRESRNLSLEYLLLTYETGLFAFTPGNSTRFMLQCSQRVRG